MTLTITDYDAIVNIVNFIDNHIPNIAKTSIENIFTALNNLNKEDAIELDNLLLKLSCFATIEKQTDEFYKVKTHIWLAILSICKYSKYLNNTNPIHNINSLDWAIRIILFSEQPKLDADDSITYDQFNEYLVDASRYGRKGTKYEEEFPIIGEINYELTPELIRYGKSMWKEIETYQKLNGPFNYITNKIITENSILIFITEKKEYQGSKLLTTIFEFNTKDYDSNSNTELNQISDSNSNTEPNKVISQLFFIC